MNNQIVTNSNISGDELQEISQNTREYMKTSNNQVLQMITEKVNGRQGLLGILFPSKIQKEHEKQTIEQMRSLFKGRKEMIEAVLNLQLTMAKHFTEMMIASKLQQWEGQLSLQAMQIRTDLTAFSQIKFNEMKTVFDKSRIEFGDRQAYLESECERHKNLDYLYKRYKHNLEFETDVFFDMIEELLTGFKDALKNKLSKYEIA